jgi:hypothetical protein
MTSSQTRSISFGLLAILTLPALTRQAMAQAELVTPVQTISPIVEIRPELVVSDADRRDDIRFGAGAPARTVGVVRDDRIEWTASARARARYGAGEDAPRQIAVRVDDTVFLIDPFLPLPTGGGLVEYKEPVGTRATRQIFGPRGTLGTDRALLNNGRRTEATERLFGELEHERQHWLRLNGYSGVRTIRNPRAADAAASTGAPSVEPLGTFRRPAELPATRSREEVNAAPSPTGFSAAGVARAMASSGGGVTRVSTPPTMPAAAAERLSGLAPAQPSQAPVAAQTPAAEESTTESAAGAEPEAI